MIKPMKMVEVDPSTVDEYLHDSDWVLEQKLDGVRALAYWDGLEVSWFSSSGGPLKFAAAAQHLPHLTTELVRLLRHSPLADVGLTLDGELMPDTGHYHVFDLPSSGLGYEGRRQELSNLLSTSRRLNVREVFTAHSTVGKRSLWGFIENGGVEGAVAKRRDGLYEPGKRVKHQVKIKMVKTADLIVTDITNWTRLTGSAELSVHLAGEDDPLPWIEERRGKLRRVAQPSNASARYSPREYLPIANASLIGKDSSIEIGGVVEVNYLYWTGTSIVQPRIMKPRHDKAAEDCLISQFPEYSRSVLV